MRRRFFSYNKSVKLKTTIAVLPLVFFAERAGAGALVPSSANALVDSPGSEVDLAPIGKHVPIFIVEKSENPQNTLTAYTVLEANCRVAVDHQDATKPILDFYWLMNRTQYKPVHPLIKSGIRDRLELVSTAQRDPRMFSIRISDLSELKTDLIAAVVQVKATAKKGGCHVDAYLRLGPSDQSRNLKLTTIYTESSKTIIPPFRKVVSVTLKGVDAQTGAAIERKYSAK